MKRTWNQPSTLRIARTSGRANKALPEFKIVAGAERDHWGAEARRAYEDFEAALNVHLGASSRWAQTEVDIRTIDERPCDPIEPDISPVCVTEDDLT